MGFSPRDAPTCLLAAALLLFCPARAAAQSAGDYVIGAQDVLAIAVFNQPALGGKYTVETDGTFTFPLVGRIKAAGLTIRQFEEELRRRFADGFFRNPQVTVAVEQYHSQRVFVVGEVRQPGTYPLTGDMTLVEALARAGSTTASASGEVVVVRSQGAKAPVIPAGLYAGPPGADGAKDAEAARHAAAARPSEALKGAEIIRVSVRDFEAGVMTQNVGLRDGDTIIVPRAELVYVFGEVKSPGSYPIQRDMTVLQALSQAGGVTQFGAMNRIQIIRIAGAEKQEVRVKLSDLVQAGDTIMVPQRFF